MPDQQRFPPDDPREWLNRARSDLALAQQQASNVYLEDLCFHVQQAAEKAIKAVLICQNVEFPYIHDLQRLLQLVAQAGGEVSPEVQQAETLTRFAVVNRYPGFGTPPSTQEYDKTLRCAQSVLSWAEDIIAEP